MTACYSNASQNLATGVFWNWRGAGSYSENVCGYSWRAGRQGHYQLCYTAFCPQNAYPRHLGTYRGNGTWGTLDWSTYG